MANFLTTVRFSPASGLSEDAVQNDFAWVASDLATLRALTTAAIPSFYNTVHSPGTVTLASRISSKISRAANACTVKYYDVTTHLDGSPHGSPVAIETFTLGAAVDGTCLPEELAVVLSFHSTLTDIPEEVGSTRPAARHRGRIYFGPLNTASNQASDCSVEPQTNAALRGAALSFLALGSAPWSVWSRANAAMYTVSGGYVDNAFDVQRRRGHAPSARTSF
jgi:hypothetical protein